MFVFVLFEKNTDNEVCVRERHFRWWLVGARPRGRTRTTGVGVSCSPAVSDGTCEAACACRIMRARYSSANSEGVSGTVRERGRNFWGRRHKQNDYFLGPGPHAPFATIQSLSLSVGSRRRARGSCHHQGLADSVGGVRSDVRNRGD